MLSGTNLLLGWKGGGGVFFPVRGKAYCLLFTPKMFTFEVLCRLSTGYNSETPERVDSGINFERSSLKKYKLDQIVKM